MLLGGLRYLIPVIKAAKSMGHYVITCDYLPNNIAHKYSDEYHNVSIIDKDAVLELAQTLQIDGIMSFAVDPGVITAAYVCEKMGLPSPGPFESVEILQNKALFRDFLESHGFNVPKSKSYNDDYFHQAIKDFKHEGFPVIVKPVDSAGSKGVVKVNQLSELEPAIHYAFKFSKSKKIIIEEYIESKGCSSDSDCFSVDGKFEVITFSAQRFDANAPNPYTPSAYSWPATISLENQAQLAGELQRLIGLLKMKSSIYNIEVREAKNNKAYIMEVSPRGGGNRLSEMIQYATQVDLISASINAALGDEIYIKPQPSTEYWAEIILYSHIAGTFKELKIKNDVRYNVIEIDLWIEEGDVVNGFTAANDAIGTLVLKFDSEEDLEMVLSDYLSYFKIIVE